MRKELGKIRSVHFGFGGYDESQFGVWFDIGGQAWGVGDGRGPWATWREGCEWTPEDQRKQWGDLCEYLRDLCKEAKVRDIHSLKGIPVECTFDGNILKEWRILKEVI